MRCASVCAKAPPAAETSHSGREKRSDCHKVSASRVREARARKPAKALPVLTPPQGFRTSDYVRDWLPIRREQCAKVGLRKSRLLRSSARWIAIRFRRLPSGTACEQTIYTWRKRFGGLQASDVRHLRQLEAENARLKKLVAERDLEIEVMKEVAAKNW